MGRFLILITCLMTWKSHGQTLVSGLDDVLRQGENTGLLAASLKMLEEDKTYSGMNRLYGLLLHRTKREKFFVLSAMPSWFEGRVADFLKENKFPPVEIKLRNIWWNWSIVNFKMRQLEEMIKVNSEGVILVLDNSQASIDFAREAKDKFGEKVDKVYLRRTVEKKMPDFSIPFITTFDIALSEMKSGRVSRRDVEQILIDLVTETDDEKLIPSYSYCPVTYSPCDEGIFANCPRLSYRIRAICRGRQGAEKEKP